ncbi:tetraspanin-5-like [Liolophura sinensis]|uniref:tetraspanin-5-like n=1 Tax=Liolophura sinensis TaxID=3198878 RepID=UPI003158B75B
MAARRVISPILKYFLFFVNFIFWLAGLGLMIIGAWVLNEKQKEVRDALDFFLDPSCVMCLTGSVTVFLAMVGGMGALRENQILLKIYHYTLSTILLGEIVLAVLLFVFYYVPDARTKLQLFPEKTFNDAIVKYRDDDDMKDLIDTIQEGLQCCGLSNTDEGYKDWNKNIYFNCTDDKSVIVSSESCSVPPSCCIRKAGDLINLQCGANALKQESSKIGNTIYTDGCIKALGTWIEAHALVVGGIALGILLPQVVLICLTRNFDDQISAQKSMWKRR